MLRLESTRACPRTPIILFALEELGAPCELVAREPGHFDATYHTAGPLLVDGGLELLEPDTILRHLARTRGAGTLWPTDPSEQALVDRWMELQSTGIRHAVIRLMRGGASDPEAGPLVARALAAFADALGEREYLLGRFTIADCPAAIFGRAPLPSGFALPAPLRAYVERLTARPAWRRVEPRLASLRSAA